MLISLIATRHDHERRQPDWPAGVFAVALIAPLLWRRRHPLAVFATIAAVAFVQWLLRLRSARRRSALLVALYRSPPTSRLRRLHRRRGVIEVGAILATPRFAPDGIALCRPRSSAPACRPPPACSASTSGPAGPTSPRCGTGPRGWSASATSRRQLAAAAERARIAREMHDIVAHNLRVMIALGRRRRLRRRAATRARRARCMTRRRRPAARRSTEMRRLLGVLRDDGRRAAQAPAGPRRARRAGRPGARRRARRSTLAVDGDAASHSAAAPQLTVYRIVQEALTNTLKHAGPKATRRGDAALRRRTASTSRSATTAAGDARRWPPGGHGHGLSGMRERAAVYGGDGRGRAASDGGWRVHTAARPSSRRAARP